MTLCYLCGKGALKKEAKPYILYGVSLGSFEAEVCGKCGETFYNEDVSRAMTAAAKEKGLWGLAAETKIGQSGTTLDVRLPKRIIEFMNLKKGEVVKLYPDGTKRLIIEADESTL